MVQRAQAMDYWAVEECDMVRWSHKHFSSEQTPKGLYLWGRLVCRELIRNRRNKRCVIAAANALLITAVRSSLRLSFLYLKPARQTWLAAFPDHWVHMQYHKNTSVLLSTYTKHKPKYRSYKGSENPKTIENAITWTSKNKKQEFWALQWAGTRSAVMLFLSVLWKSWNSQYVCLCDT